VTTRRAKPTHVRDWDKNKLLIALRQRDLTWAQLSRENGYPSAVLRTVTTKRWPKAERIVAEALGLTPQQIWPSRYPATPAQKRAA
jgi:Ner family transcriptional regulator